MSAPTGPIDRKDVTPTSAPGAAQLPYPMQLGSGTWDAIVGATAMGQAGAWSWDAQGVGTTRTETNDRGYSARGSRRLDGVVSRKVADA